jgi:hypothetical protein
MLMNWMNKLFTNKHTIANYLKCNAIGMKSMQPADKEQEAKIRYLHALNDAYEGLCFAEMDFAVSASKGLLKREEGSDYAQIVENCLRANFLYNFLQRYSDSFIFLNGKRQSVSAIEDLDLEMIFKTMKSNSEELFAKYPILKEFLQGKDPMALSITDYIIRMSTIGYDNKMSYKPFLLPSRPAPKPGNYLLYSQVLLHSHKQCSCGLVSECHSIINVFTDHITMATT